MSELAPLYKQVKRYPGLGKSPKPCTGLRDRPVYDVLNGKRRKRWSPP